MSERLSRMLAGRGTRPLVVPYLTAGYPAATETVDLLRALEEGGADAIEVGLPFSDPLADGPVIQAASQRALEGGITWQRTLDLVATFRRTSQLPLLFMGYVNPILARGAAATMTEAAAAGVDGLIVPDLPPEESGPFHEPAVAAGLSWVPLAAPTSTDARLSRIDALATHFNYCVSLTGVTGARAELPADLSAYLERARRVFTKPFVVGFGISRPEHVARVVPPAAGVVVGSALLAALAVESDGAGRRRRARDLVRSLRG
jgi:tryptophan synthase alpha chain